MNYTVSAMNLSKISLNETDPVKAVLQNVAIILATRQQSVPLYRGFGLSMQYLDKPIPVAQQLITAELMDIIHEYEPRATVTNVTFETDEDVPGRLIPTVEVEISDE